MDITKSLGENIQTIEGNGLAVFVDDNDSALKLKDIYGTISPISCYTGSSGGGLSYFTTSCQITCGRTESILASCGSATTIDAVISSKGSGRIQFADDSSINTCGNYIDINRGQMVLGGSVICNSWTGVNNTLALGSQNVLKNGRCGVVVGFRNTMCTTTDNQRFNSIFGQDNILDSVGERNNLFGRGNLNCGGINTQIFGGENTSTSSSYSFIGGFRNTISSSGCSTTVGNFSTTTSNFSTNLGYCNINSGVYSSLLGGSLNVSSGCASNIVGGLSNRAVGVFSSVGGGQSNCASGCFSKISSGKSNSASGVYSSIFAGQTNKATGLYSNVTQGLTNCATNQYSNVLGGTINSNNGDTSTIVGGSTNTISGYGSYGSIVGGNVNKLCGSYGFIGGGTCNSIQNILSSYSSIVGGLRSCVCAGSYNSVLNGLNNTMCHDYSAISGCAITTDRACTLFVNNLSIKNIPTSSAGLPSGSVWSNSGVLTIVP